MGLIRKMTEFALTDPFGDLCLAGGGYAAATGNLPILGAGVALFGAYHLANMHHQRINLRETLQNPKISIPEELERHNRAALCARWMTLAHLYGNEALTKYRGTLKPWPLKHYAGREWRKIKIGARILARGENPIKTIFK